MDAPQFTLHKRVEAEDMIVALDDLDRILTATCKTPLQRHEAMAYVMYRGLQAIREEYADAFAAHEAQTHRHQDRDTGRYDAGYRTFMDGTVREDFGSDR